MTAAVAGRRRSRAVAVGPDGGHGRFRRRVVGRVREDRGGATVWVLAVGLVAVLLAMAWGAVGSAMVARHRAQAAADLGALAGAARAVDGAQSACDRAAEIVRANSAAFVGCELDGFDLVVTARTTPAGLAAMVGTAQASARAGPVEPDG
jgi:secretion/DNA translocation related TadE-like protein